MMSSEAGRPGERSAPRLPGPLCDSLAVRRFIHAETRVPFQGTRVFRRAVGTAARVITDLRQHIPCDGVVHADHNS